MLVALEYFDASLLRGEGADIPYSEGKIHLIQGELFTKKIILMKACNTEAINLLIIVENSRQKTHNSYLRELYMT